MTKEEAQKVLEIMRTADGGCEYCVKELLDQFEEAFPEFKHLQ